MTRSRGVAAVCAGAAVATALFALAAGIRLHGPLAGPGDASIWEYPGFYVSTHLRLTPWPRLELFSDQALFPYGVSSVFQPWAPERDAFFAALFSRFGAGPWLQTYVLISVFVTVAGTLVIVGRELGAVRAAFAAALVTVFDLPAMAQYPNHLNLCVLHWATLGILTDFVIVRRVVIRTPLSARLVLLRLALVALSLGLDLAYVAGLALTSFVLSAGFAVVVIASRRPLGNPLATVRRELGRHPGSIVALGLVLTAATFAYVPLALQIARAARSPELAGLPTDLGDHLRLERMRR